MCGVVGLYGGVGVGQRLYDALTLLQHRGQDSAGIVTSDLSTGCIYQRKGNGLVRDVFRGSHIAYLQGQAGIGHVRYPTAGTSSESEAQPFYVNSPYGIALGHNGNLTNFPQLMRELFNQNLRHLNTGSDSEVMLNVLAHELLSRRSLMFGPEQVFQAVSQVHRRCQGAYAVVALFAGLGLLAFRDPYGIRPLIYGAREGKHGTEYIVASESVVLDSLGFEIVRDIAPGEAIYIDKNGELHTRLCVNKATYRTCIFEYVYFSRPDSVIDDVFVHKARMRMGVALGDRIKREWGDHGIDVVMPVPDTSRTAALEMAMKIGVKYREGFIKNRYIGRTFIMPWQTMRMKSVRQKLNPLSVEFKDKNVLLVDDSIVRGTTSRQIVQMARDAGARKVYFASASPPIKHPNVYGIDMSTSEELIAHGKSDTEVCKAIQADRLIYQNLKDLVGAVSRGNPKLKKFECSVFDGNYIHELDGRFFEELSRNRKDSARDERKDAVDLHSSM